MMLIKDFPDYKIDRRGNVWSIKSNRYLRWHDNGNGYFYVRLRKNKTTFNRYVHRLVAEAFVPNPENKPEVNHEFGDKSDNYYKHLEWVTHIENSEHAWETGLMTLGENHHCSKLSDLQVSVVRTTEADTTTNRLLAKAFKVNERHIRRIRNNKRRIS